MSVDDSHVRRIHSHLKWSDHKQRAIHTLIVSSVTLVLLGIHERGGIHH